MAKKIVDRPSWMKCEKVQQIWSVSGCVSPNFTNYINYWKHNGYWLFDNPKTILEIMKLEGLNFNEFQLFFYEVFEKQYCYFEKAWETFEPEATFETNVIIPRQKILVGFDIVTYYCGNAAEHSPLSCNSLADEVEVNSRCLMASLDAVTSIVTSELYEGCEEGPARLIAVYSCPNWNIDSLA